MDLLTTSFGDASSVQVALRIRPQGNREKLDGSKVCTSVIPNEPQVTIGGDRSFTYDNVFDTNANQTEIYEKCIEKLVEGTFDGFNATVLAYGQTGSGKTYTMGTAFDAGNIPDELIGVVPRAVYHVFRRIGELRAEAADKGIVPPTFDVSVQFIELYNEEILDLLSDDRASSSNIRIHEDTQKNEIYLHGCANRLVSDAHQTLEILKNGALNRTVAATNMNEQSSRSHAIFTMQIRQQRVAVHGESAASGETELEILTAKFHFVDLAGSERLKRTGATGDRAKEGISINCGLLALGNVISALGGASGKVSHVPYRDSKLTRLLQDSLGGNSRTLMIACVSPSDSDFVETLNTMKYANRAKNIKNKVVANQDKSSKAIGELRARIAQLETELLEYRQGRRTIDEDGLEVVSDQYHENVMLTAEVNQLRFRVKALQETNEILRGRNVDLKMKADCAKVGVIFSGDGKDNDAFSNIVKGYVDEVERIQSQLYESQATCEQLRKESTRWKSQAMNGGGMGQSMGLSMFETGGSQLIQEARGDVEKLRGRLASIQANDNGETSDYASPVENTEEDATDEGEGDDEDELPDDETPATIALRENLADLQTEINIKERLITELERSEKRLSEVRITYEKKLSELSTRIKATEAERDRMLAEMASKGGDKAGEEKAKIIREDYERKLADMRHEFKKLQMIEREHKRMQARQEVERQQMLRYQSELKDLKKIKVDLVKKIRDEIKRSQQDSMKNAKKIAALDKEARKKDNQIRTLEMKDKQREAFMKRTTEEMNRLRKAQRDSQRSANGQTRNQRGGVITRGPIRSNQKEIFNPRAAKAKWTAIEKKFMRLVSEKQTVHKMEEELERRIGERHVLLDQTIALEKAFVSVQEVAEREAIGEELEGVREKLSYVQDLIQEAQQSIASVDDKGEEDDRSKGVEQLIEETRSVPEAVYLLHHISQFALEQATMAARSNANQKEAEARIIQLEQQSFINEQLLESVIIDHNIVEEISRAVEGQNDRKNSRTQSRGSSSNRVSSPSQSNTNEDSPLHEYKVRRRTATADELLYPQDEDQKGDPNGLPSQRIPNPQEDRLRRKNVHPLPSISSSTHPPPFSRNSKLRSTIGSLPSISSQSSNKLLSSQRKSSNNPLRGLSPRLPPLSEVSSPPQSNSFSPRLLPHKSVFQRLHPSENSPQFILNRPLAREEYKKGQIISSNEGGNGERIIKTALLDGHVKPVLSIDGYQNLLISGSKDRLAKVWDLERGEEVATLGIHPNNVHSVRFIPNSHLAVSTSMYQMRIWDLREMKCVRLLQSSGQVVQGDGGSIGSRQNTVPFLETVVNAIEIDPTGELLFSSFCGDVRVWCLSKMASFGRLVGAAHSPRSEVSCLSVALDSERNVCKVFTGSRDHYVKMYSLPINGHGVHEATVEFNPPHYDNVTCIVHHDGHIYTASKDMNIMKINLSDNKRDHLELKAHNSYVQGLCMVPLGSETLLTSVCKEGTIKLWDVTSTRRMRLVETIEKAHQESINNICYSSGLIFTASSDTTVGVWRPKSSI